ncbi:Aspartic peptidase A1 family [Fusarium oxysporum f. sp. vasinfectum]|nr:Aspartic peptidase A1 family [Fusarium oxysporum f. sp. vasinfectum]
MKFSSVVTSGLASFTLVAGLPTVTSPNEHSVQQVRNPVYKRNGIAALGKIYRKYHIDLPEYLENSVLARRDSTGTVANKPIENNSEWLTPVQIGNPPRTFQMDLDTGSSDLWVYGSKAATAGGSSNRYNASNSKSCEEMAGAKWTIKYGDGSGASGHVVKDTVSIGGLSVEAQAVQVADKVHESFAQQQDLDGLLGLGFSSINTVTPKKQKTFFENAKTEHGTGHTRGDITYTTVDSSTGMWTFTSTGFAVGKGNITKTPITAIADTGTSLMFLPEQVNKAYYSQIDGARVDTTAGGYVFPCDTKMPDFTFYMGETGITVPGVLHEFRTA